MPLKRLFAAALLAGAALLAAPGPAHAQTTTCAEDDLRCRIAVLEARLDDLTRRLETPSAAGATSTPLASTFNLRRLCGTNCQAEALAACQERGFSTGRPEDWERPRGGSATLTRVICTR